MKATNTTKNLVGVDRDISTLLKVNSEIIPTTTPQKIKVTDIKESETTAQK